MEKLGTEKIEAIGTSLTKVIVLGKKIASDKKVGLEDLPHVIAFIPELAEVVENFKHFGDAIDEGKDIDVAEVVALIQFVHKKVKEVEAA